MSWSNRFDEPIGLRGGRKLRNLKEESRCRSMVQASTSILVLHAPSGCGTVMIIDSPTEGDMTTVFKSEIEWRSDIDAAPKDRRILMIVTPIVNGHADVQPEIVVGHSYDVPQNWVIADTFGEPRKNAARLKLIPRFWAELGTLLPRDVNLRPLGVGDFKG
jgi:uncharacterized protein YceK